ncbi:MAG: putative toxin-antitoxin system toxin component, PIN family [Armatimonadota bacterium]
MTPRQIVIDTCVLAAALRSNRGASFRLLTLVGECARFQVHVSVPLVLEYEDVAKRQSSVTGLADRDIDDIIDYLCSVAHRHPIFFLWRPFLRDPGDDLVLEVAVEGRCDAIITFNIRDFAGAERFGLRILSPKQFLEEIGELP